MNAGNLTKPVETSQKLQDRSRTESRLQAEVNDNALPAEDPPLPPPGDDESDGEGAAEKDRRMAAGAQVSPLRICTLMLVMVAV